MKILNTISGKKEEFIPRKGKKVQMFVCGPTVYDYIHIGNARTFVFFDVIAKYLRHRGYEVNYIQNITDIDNKIIERAQKENADPLEYAKKYSDIFKENMKALNVTSPEYKNATDHIPEMIKQVQTLLDKGNAYVIKNDGIYFDLSTFPDYGKLSGRTAGMADDAVSRIDDSDKKRNRGDFAIWKFSQENDPSWPAPFGAGRPGWHIEDTAITEKYFSPQYDIHGGGQDLIFPHHEAEIAQQCSAALIKPKDFVKYWMHVGFLVNKEEKMSKSLGNFETLHETLKKYSPEVLRFYFLSAHYRSPLDFNDKIIKASQAATNRLAEFVRKLKEFGPQLSGGQLIPKNYISGLDGSFKRAMDNDFNTPETFETVFQLLNKINPLLDAKGVGQKDAEKLLEILDDINTVMGVIPVKQEKIPAEICELVEKREKLRKEEKWEDADKIRAQIEDRGYQVEDTVYGPLVIKIVKHSSRRLYF